MTAEVGYDQVLAWRFRRQSLDPRTKSTAAELVDRLAGVQAQVASSTELAIALRQCSPELAGVAAALEARTVVKT